LHGTRVYRHDDPSLIPLLVTMLHKVNNSPRDAPPNLDAVHPRLCASSAPFCWKQPAEPFALRLWAADLQHAQARAHSDPDSDSNRLLLLQDYRYGGDGRVWLVADPSGVLGVLKFPIRFDQPAGQLHKEAAHWNRL